jgi:hypothetical protein
MTFGVAAAAKNAPLPAAITIPITDSHAISCEKDPRFRKSLRFRYIVKLVFVVISPVIFLKNFAMAAAVAAGSSAVRSQRAPTAQPAAQEQYFSSVRSCDLVHEPVRLRM